MTIHIPPLDYVEDPIGYEYMDDDFTGPQGLEFNDTTLQYKKFIMEINPNSKSYRGVPIIDTFNHEYGHSIQMGKLNPIGYTLLVFIPSVTSYWLQRKEILIDSYSYYSVPWEYQANLYGGVRFDKNKNNYAPGTEDAYNKYKIIVGE